MISKGCLVRYTNPHAAMRGTPAAHRHGLCYNGVYLVTSEPYMTERREAARMGGGWLHCYRKVLVDGRDVIVDVMHLEKVE